MTIEQRCELLISWSGVYGSWIKQIDCESTALTNRAKGPTVVWRPDLRHGLVITDRGSF